jgi:transposase
MTKFSKEIRVKVIMDIESGNSIRGAARKFGISRAVIQVWVRHYEAGGIEQLISARKKYSQEFKWKAIEYRQKNGLSYPQAVADLGIPNVATLFSWEKQYSEQGLDGLQDKKKGRLLKMSKKDKKKLMTREQELEAENVQLRMENDYLKKLNALVQEREKSKKKIK